MTQDLFDWLVIPAPPPVSTNSAQGNPSISQCVNSPNLQSFQYQPRKINLTPSSNPKAAKLRELAGSMKAQIDAKLNPAIGQQRTTNRRANIAASMREEGRKLECIQTWLYALADAWDNDAVPTVLQGIGTRKILEYFADMIKSPWCYDSRYNSDWEEASVAKVWDISRDYYESWRKSLSGAGIYNLQQTMAAINAIKSLGQQVQVDPKVIKLEKMQLDLVGTNIPGYFPTPKKVCERMLELAELKPWMRVLETSAGSGHLVDAIASSSPGIDIDCCEVNFQLREALKLKGYRLYAEDFLQSVDGATPLWDAIVQNPPFEHLQDIDFVRHAYRCLKPDGRLVSVMSVAWTYNKKAADFRDWVKSVGGYWEDCPEGAFYESDRPTGVRCGILVILK